MIRIGGRKTVCRLISFGIPWAHNNNFEPGIPLAMDKAHMVSAYLT